MKCRILGKAALIAQVNFISMWLILLLYLLLLAPLASNPHLWFPGEFLRQVKRIRKNMDLTCLHVCGDQLAAQVYSITALQTESLDRPW